MSRRRRRNSGNPVEVEVQKVPMSRFWKVLWLIIGILVFLSITSVTGFYAPDLYMLLIYGFIIIVLNIYLLYLLWKDKSSDT